MSTNSFPALESKHRELFVDSTGLLVVDVQERLAAAMPEKVLKGTIRNWLNLIEAARVLGLPVAFSQQYPKGLGPTLPVVAESILRLPREMVFKFDKLQFSCLNDAIFHDWVRATGRPQWIIAGMETHICVHQTVRSFTQQGFVVHVPRDAVISRSMANWEIGLNLMAQCDAIVSCTESVIFDLLKRGGTEEFKLLSRVVK